MRKILLIVLVIASVNTRAQEEKTPSRSCDANSTTEDCLGPKRYKQTPCNTKECIQSRQDSIDENREMRSPKPYRTSKYYQKKKTVECEHAQMDGQLVLICADGTYIKSSTAVDYSRRLEEVVERDAKKEKAKKSGATKD